MGELFCGAAGEGLAPDVGDAAMSDGVVEALASGEKTGRAPPIMRSKEPMTDLR